MMKLDLLNLLFFIVDIHTIEKKTYRINAKPCRKYSFEYSKYV